jgi:Fic family protein
MDFGSKGVTHMLFATPPIGREEAAVLERIDDLRRTLKYQVAGRRRWVGTLRRVSFARALQGSNSIEGYNVTLDDAVAAADNEEPLDAEGETWAAVLGYRDAMTYVVQLADDPYFSYGEDLLRSLHFMMLKYDLSRLPGRWRPGPIYVHNEVTDQIVYEGPDASMVPKLMSELVAALTADTDGPVMVRAAMAHLNLVMIHPFKDGNGRMARALQTLVLAREGILASEFCSIEEYLGHNTQAYYDVLAEVGQGTWQPGNNALPWVRFTLTAHYRQAQTLLRRVKQAERLWSLLEREVERVGLPERVIPGLFYVSGGRRLRRVTYRSMAAESDLGEVSEAMASRDLRTLVEAGFLLPVGERRGRFYLPTDRLRAIRTQTREQEGRKIEDPFAAVA